MVVACFLPWVHINSIHETMNGFNPRPFATGNNYGKAGKFIVAITSIIFIGMVLPKIWAKRLNLFLSALLLAFVLRTYVIFTGSLFENEVIKKPGIYLIVISALLILFSSVFSKVNSGKASS
jgi:hypothetical protein